LYKIIQYCKDYNHTYEFKDNKFYGLPFEINENISPEGVKDYVTSISKHTPRDYQNKGIYEALYHNRKVIVSPTASGKSLMIYSLVRYYTEKENNILIIVPTTSLVSQLYKDFVDYGWNAEEHCHLIYSGREKDPIWIYVTTENGFKYKFDGNETITLINNKKKLAKDLEEYDEIDDRWLLSIKK
jgi:superfamily II DNA or RNA helicase